MRVDPPFDGQSFVYRTGESSYEHDPYAQFLVPSAETLRSAVEKDFESAGVFKHISDRGSLCKPDTILEMRVSHLYGDFRKNAPPAAVLELHLTLFNDAPGGPRGAVLDKHYSRRIEIAARTPSALVGGWNEAIKQIISRVSRDFQSQAANKP